MKISSIKKDYEPPCILSLRIAPDLTKCMQNTGGIEKRSTFQIYKSLVNDRKFVQKKQRREKRVINKNNSDKSVSRRSTAAIILTLMIYIIGSGFVTRTISETKKEIPILIPQKHPVIDEIVNGVNKGFLDLGYTDSILKTVIMDGQGVPANISSIIDAAIQRKPPCIITITTGLSKLTVDKVQGVIPVIFSGVTDPVGSAIVPDLVKHGRVTGASDLWPIEDQFNLIRLVIPSVKNVGVIFRPSEPNSQFGMRIAREAAKRLNINLIERGVEDAKEIVPVLDAILPQVDAIYIGPDNMTIESAKVIIESSTQARKPVFGGEPGTLEKGAVGVVSINYFELGRQTAVLCDKILKGTPTEQIPVYVAERGFIGLNFNTSTQLNLSIDLVVRQKAINKIGEYKEPSNLTFTTNTVFILGGIVVISIIIGMILIKKRKTT